ncbi:MAG: iron-sulfur cluster assembly accessory protein [Burkholderiales bacterium]
MTISLTAAAARQIKANVAKLGGIGLRLDVRKVGCSGLAYAFDMAQEVGPGEHLFEDQDAKLVVTDAALRVIDGSELDYIREGFKQMFTVRNPNVKSTCGCGESFSV